MPDPTTTNIVLSIPTRGSDPGTWDVPINGDMTILDACAGSVTSKTLSNSNVVLTATESQVSIIRLSGTLTSNVQVTTGGIIKSWIVENLCVGAFVVTLTGGSGRVVGIPPGGSQIYWDGTNMQFVNLGVIGEYKDIVASTVPGWISACTVPPYLLCDGSAVSAITYPILTGLFGITTLPDLRGRARFYLNSGTGRITTAGSGIDGNTILSAGGDQTVTLVTANLPAYTPAGTTALNFNAHNRSITTNTGSVVVLTGSLSATNPDFNYFNSGENFGGTTGPNLALTGTAQGGISTPVNKMPPACIGGITLIRAA